MQFRTVDYKQMCSSSIDFNRDNSNQHQGDFNNLFNQNANPIENQRMVTETNETNNSQKKSKKFFQNDNIRLDVAMSLDFNRNKQHQEIFSQAKLRSSRYSRLTGSILKSNSKIREILRRKHQSNLSQVYQQINTSKSRLNFTLQKSPN